MGLLNGATIFRWRMQGRNRPNSLFDLGRLLNAEGFNISTQRRIDYLEPVALAGSTAVATAFLSSR